MLRVTMGHILLIGPDEAFFNELRANPGLREHDVQSCASFVDAMRLLRQQRMRRAADRSRYHDQRQPRARP